MEFLAPAPENSAPLRVQTIVERWGGELLQGGDHEVDGVLDLPGATAQQACFWNGRAQTEGCSAGLVFVPAGKESAVRVEELPASLRALPALIAHPRPDLAAAQLSQHFDLARPRWTGIHERASIDPHAVLGEGCTVHAGASIAAHVRLGAGCVIHPNVVIYEGVQLGEGCVIHANTVIGADGFGYVWSGQAHEKVPQRGAVRIGRGVEIGSCTTIDRGTFRDTEIGDGCIIDNQVQLGHNCKLGRFVVMCAQVGLAGSTEVGDGAILGGRAASSGHLRIGAGVQMAGAAVATKDIADGQIVGGYPAWDLRSETRVIAKMRRGLKS